MIRLLRWLLLPISLLYAIAVLLRNVLYDLGILSSKRYAVRSIVIGNLAVGGSGKTPMTECLVRWFENEYTIATLSRGYGRKTKGFRYVNLDDNAINTGDEPLQFKHKFPTLTVAVCEDRRTGIETLMQAHNLILLDDAFQHRRIAATCNILLFEYASLLGPIIPLPTGNFRDLLPQAKRADLIIITKIPKKLSANQRAYIEQKLRRHSDAPIYFASIAYAAPKAFSVQKEHALINSADELLDKQVLLVTGIANPKPLLDYVSKKALSVEHIALPDHHIFTPANYEQILATYAAMATRGDTILITTEKDAQRLSVDSLHHIPSYYIPITFVFDNENQLRADLINTLTSYSVNEP